MAINGLGNFAQMGASQCQQAGNPLQQILMALVQLIFSQMMGGQGNNLLSGQNPGFGGAGNGSSGANNMGGGISDFLGGTPDNLGSNLGTSATGNKLADYAAGWNGKAFKAGQTKRCADFVSTMLRQSGTAPPGFKHTALAADFAKYGQAVGKGALKPGDVVLFGNTYRQGKYTHVGIYLGDGKFVHRPTANKPVRIDNLSSGYYSSKFTEGRRL